MCILASGLANVRRRSVRVFTMFRTVLETEL